MDRTTLHAAMAARLPAMLDDIGELVRCESPSSVLDAVAASADVVAKTGQDLLGVAPERVVLGRRTHLRWRLGDGPRRVLVLAHHDTVWPLGTLAAHPFTVTDGVLRGPGCFDMKTGIVLALHAIAALPDAGGVTLLVTGDEELGSPTSRELIAAVQAKAAADAAAEAAGVRIRELADLADLEAACRLFDQIWRPSPANPPLTVELMRALTKAGNYAAGAYDGSRLVGACVGFFGPPAEEALHSHIAGVSPAAAGRSVGFALKVHQRAWALRHEVVEIGWTFDPLVRRNAYFNLVKLGARPAEYLPNFYGGMNDGINGASDSDRLLVLWDLYSPLVAAACAGKFSPASAQAQLARGAVAALSAGADGWPVPGTALAGSPGSVHLVAVPADIEGLRLSDPPCAAAWRIAVRDALSPLMAAGGRVTGFDKAGWYVVETPAAAGTGTQHEEESR